MRTSHTVVLFVLAVIASTAALQWIQHGSGQAAERPATVALPPGYPTPSAAPMPMASLEPRFPAPVGVQGSMPPPSSFPVAQPANPRDAMAQDPRTQLERQDFGVPPTAELHAGAMHGPTPSSIPGGQVVTTPGLIALLDDRSFGARVFDVLGGPESLPGAIPAVPASQPGSFQDTTQQQFGQFLQQTTQGRRDVPLVFYCASSQCWMSYNAALRAIRLGYTNVLWYRGGLEAWQAAGRPTQRVQQGSMAQGTALPMADPRNGWNR